MTPTAPVRRTQFGASITRRTQYVAAAALAFHYAGHGGVPDRSDQAFHRRVEAVRSDMFGQIVSGVTLVATTGSGLPNLARARRASRSRARVRPPRSARPIRIMDCAAETTILAHFGDPSRRRRSQREGGRRRMRLAAARVGGRDPGVGGLGIRVADGAGAADVRPRGADSGRGAVQFVVLESPRLPEGCYEHASCPTSKRYARRDAAFRRRARVTSGCIPVACIPQACLAPGGVLRISRAFMTFVLTASRRGLAPAGAGGVQRAECFLRRDAAPRASFARTPASRAAQLSADLLAGHSVCESACGRTQIVRPMARAPPCRRRICSTWRARRSGNRERRDAV